MLGWILLGAIVGIAIITIISPYLNRNIANRFLKDNKVVKASIRSLFKEKNITHINLDGLDEEYNETKIEIVTEAYDPSEIYEGVTLCP